MNQYLVSVVIPTFNRYEYLKPAVESLVRIPSTELEVVIQDNTVENQEIVDFLEQLNDDRIQYFHQRKHISMTENCERGVQNSRGKYVCLIGDDDTVCENIIDAANYCEENRIDASMYPFPGFNWPDMTFEGGKEGTRFVLRVSC